MPSSVVGYWKCRGYSHPIRLLLEHVGEPYEFVTYQCGPGPVYGIKGMHSHVLIYLLCTISLPYVGWLAKKHFVLPHHDYPNLPYYDDRETTRLTHYVAILQYLGRKYGLHPKDSDPQDVWVATDMMREQLRDVADANIDHMYFPEHRKQGSNPTLAEKIESKKRYEERLTMLLRDIERKMAKYPSTAKFTTGENLSYVDFIAWENLDYVTVLLGNNWLRDMQFNRLQGFYEAFQTLPRVRAYLTSDRFKRFPLYGERSFLGREESELI